MSWPDEVMEDWNPKDRLRFDLVKIAFKEALRDEEAGSSANIATKVVDYADAVLAEMEREPPTKAEIERRARRLANADVSPLRTIRAKLQETLAQDQHANAMNPTNDQRVLGFRDGSDSGTAMAVRLIDAAMEKMEAENPDAE